MKIEKIRFEDRAPGYLYLFREGKNFLKARQYDDTLYEVSFIDPFPISLNSFFQNACTYLKRTEMVTRLRVLGKGGYKDLQ